MPVIPDGQGPLFAREMADGARWHPALIRADVFADLGSIGFLEHS
jgi:hypothetical protein